MVTQNATEKREILLVENARIRPMMGIDVLESLPHTRIPYSLVDPYVLVHEATVPITPERARLDTEHPHRGFDNLWYLIGPGSVLAAERAEAGTRFLLMAGRPYGEAPIYNGPYVD